jgi:hypothetical protein
MKSFFSLLGLLFFIFVIPVEARLLPRFRSSSGAGRKTAGSGVIVSPRLSSDRKALQVYFANLDKAKEVSYTLSYQTNGKDEGVYGLIDSSTGNTTTRELLFGTCSSGVCRYHTGITGMKFEVTVELPSGKKAVRRYRIKV